LAKSVNSADISLLDFSVLLDISVAEPYISISNLSTVVNPDSLKWVFKVVSPSGTIIHEGNFDTPDVDQEAFTTFLFQEKLPKYFGQVEFSKNPYTIIVQVKDSADNVFELSKAKSICKPNGNNGKGNFGLAEIGMEVQCGQGRLVVTDKTNLIYQNLTGTAVSTNVELSFPKDIYGNQPDTISVQSIPAIFPIKYEGEGHELYAAHVYAYDLGDNFIVRVRYSFIKIFAVWCNVTLQPLFCEIDRITNLVQSCNNNAETREAQEKLTVVNAKMLKAHTGIVQPFSGIDVPKTIQDIKEILGIEDNCFRPAGINNTGSLMVTDAIFTANKVCGDMLLSWEQDEFGNISLNYQNATYTFVISDASSSNAFSYDPIVTAACNKQIALKVDIEVLAQEFIDTIKNSQSLTNQLNAIITQNVLNCSSIDGKSVFSSSICNYSVDILTTPSGVAMKSIVIGGNTYDAPDGLIATDAGGIETWLNSLSLGSFAVSYNSGTGKTTITSSNVNLIATVSTILVSTVKNYQVISDCGLICSILQKIIDWADTLNFSKLTSDTVFTICRFNDDGTVNQKVFNNEDEEFKLEHLATYWSDSFCNIVNFLKTRYVSCENVKNIFAAFSNATSNPNGSDIVLAIVNGKCQQIPVKNLALSVFGLLGSDADVKNVYCLYSKCTTVNDCTPVTSLISSINDTSASFSWAPVVGATGYKWSINGTTWTFVSTTAALVTGLTANTAYVFRIYPVYTTGDAVDCTITQNFTTSNAGSACAAPANLETSNATSSSVILSWDAVAGASGYQYRINSGSWVNTGNVLNITVTGITTDTEYIFDVRAIIGGTPCTEFATVNGLPTLTQISNTDTGAGGTRTQIAQVGFAVAAGYTYTAQVYSHPVTYTAISGDTPADVAIGLRDLINATTEAEWDSASSAPPTGTNGFKPVATASGANITIVLNYQNAFAFSAAD